jgi:hypothetical protein
MMDFGPMVSRSNWSHNRRFPGVARQPTNGSTAAAERMVGTAPATLYENLAQSG